MKAFTWLLLLSTLVLSSCAAPLLLLSPQTQLMMNILKPMIGLDPNKAGFFDQPVIQDRLKPLLGPYFADTLTILKTAERIQQQGPLIYLVSKDSPLPAVAEKAGLVYNSETNQLAVMLITGGAPQVFAEKLNGEFANTIPSWPTELADFTSAERIQQKMVHAATDQLPVDDRTKALMNSTAQQGAAQTVRDELNNSAKPIKDAVTEQVKQSEPVKDTIAAKDKMIQIARLQRKIAVAQQRLATAKDAKELKDAQQELNDAKQQLQALESPTTQPH